AELHLSESLPGPVQKSAECWRDDRSGWDPGADHQQQQPDPDAVNMRRTAVQQPAANASANPIRLDGRTDSRAAVIG
ncbi:MAG: hypothetical protein J2P29_10325, partial [Actinobacteria bacterium]|nr:hypothetical protein [Actinomycetota bacterium]